MVISPVALIIPLTYSPVDAQTTTFAVPPILTVAFPPPETIVTLLEPKAIAFPDVVIPVSWLPSPMKYGAITLPEDDTFAELIK